jgi:hypothetical protein
MPEDGTTEWKAPKRRREPMTEEELLEERKEMVRKWFGEDG